MVYRNSRSTRKAAAYDPAGSMTTFIARLRKIRALNGDPALFGIHASSLRKMNLAKMNFAARF
jgi:hypothetical protein